MKNKIGRYNASDVTKVLWLYERIYVFNDFDNVYYFRDNKEAFVR